jgi:hypothetical protein
MPRKKGVPYARSDQLKERHAFSITRKAYDGFKRLAARLDMSMSAIMEALGRGELYVTDKPRTFEEAIAAWDMEELATDALIPYERLIDIVEHKEEPNTDELTGLAASLQLEPSELRNLIRNRKQNGERQANGC